MAGQRPTSPGDTAVYHAIKRLGDVLVSGAAVVVAAIPVAACCIAIRLDSPGNPIFVNTRVGQYGKPLKVLKLRSMYIDAESNMGKYLTPEQIQAWETEHKLDDDPRITRVGRFIRATSLDELPQFLNVLAGQMSIVGPRPITREETEWFGDDLEEALSVKPGITGWWQVTERNDATWESGRRQELELWYVRNRGIALDMKIFLMTFGAMLKRTGK